MIGSFRFTHRLKNVRFFRSGKPSSSSSSILDADSSKSLTKLYHSSAIFLVVLTPVAFALSPSKFNLPVDLALGILFPIHSHIGINYIISDYAPKAIRGVARIGLLGVTVITVAGLLRLNLQGVGLTESLKSLWRKKKAAKA